MLMASIFFLVLSLALVCFLRPEDYQSIYLVAILSVTYLFKPFRVIGFYFESKIESKRTVPYHIIGLLVSSILKIYCILIQSSLYAFAWVTVAEGLVSTIGLLHVYHQNRSNLSISWFSPKWALAKTLLKDSLPFMLSSVMIAIYMKIDQIMLREMVSAKEVGFYSVAVTLTSVWYIIPIGSHCHPHLWTFIYKYRYYVIFTGMGRFFHWFWCRQRSLHSYDELYKNKFELNRYRGYFKHYT